MRNTPQEPAKATLVRIPVGEAELEGALAIPLHARGIIIFAHGSGSSRHSPRNQFVAEQFQKESFATLLVDLLTPSEDDYYGNRFDIELLTERLLAITDWVAHHEPTAHLDVGYFGASTGAAATLRAAVRAPQIVKAVVSRGGRVDMAEDAIEQVAAPTLLIIGQHDIGVHSVNEEAFYRLQCDKELAEVPNATHVFEEPGALEHVAALSAEWFKGHLAERAPNESRVHGRRH